MKIIKISQEQIFSQKNPSAITSFGDDIAMGLWRGRVFIAIVEHPESYEGAEYRGATTQAGLDELLSNLQGYNTLGKYHILP